MTVFDPSLEPIATLFRLWLRFMVWILRIVPVCCVIALPAVMVFDRLSPWPLAIEALSPYPNQTRLCVGLSSESHRTASGYHAFIQRTFVLLPRAFTEPSVISITSTDGAAPVIEESRFGFWFGSACYLLMLMILGCQIRGLFSRRDSQATGIA